MLIGGLQKLSLSDFPGRLSAVVFTQGCNLRCRYCHNPTLVVPDMFDSPLRGEEVLRYLSRRRVLLRGVVISGGEPTLQGDLADYLRSIRSLGLAIKLDTNGTRPGVLLKLIAQSLLDYVALDVKGPPSALGRVTASLIDPDLVCQSMLLLKDSGVRYEVRTTFSESLLDPADLRELAEFVRPVGRLVLQGFRNVTTLDPSLKLVPDTRPESLDAARVVLEERSITVDIRT